MKYFLFLYHLILYIFVLRLCLTDICSRTTCWSSWFWSSTASSPPPSSSSSLPGPGARPILHPSKMRPGKLQLQVDKLLIRSKMKEFIVCISRSWSDPGPAIRWDCCSLDPILPSRRCWGDCLLGGLSIHHICFIFTNMAYVLIKFCCVKRNNTIDINLGIVIIKPPNIIQHALTSYRWISLKIFWWDFFISARHKNSIFYFSHGLVWQIQFIPIKLPKTIIFHNWLLGSWRLFVLHHGTRSLLQLRRPRGARGPGAASGCHRGGGVTIMTRSGVSWGKFLA